MDIQVGYTASDADKNVNLLFVVRGVRCSRDPVSIGGFERDRSSMTVFDSVDSMRYVGVESNPVSPISVVMAPGDLEPPPRICVVAKAQ